MFAITIGWVIALVILILTIVFIAVGQVPVLIAGVALARVF
jgi:hypothetical protein